MPASTNVLTPFYMPGNTISGRATANITGKRCVRISASRVSGPGVSDAVDGGNYQVATAAAGGRIFGVAGHDATPADKNPVPIHKTPGSIVPIFAEAAIAFNTEVMVGAAGGVIAFVAGGANVAIGYTVTAALINTDAEICLY